MLRYASGRVRKPRAKAGRGWELTVACVGLASTLIPAAAAQSPEKPLPLLTHTEQVRRLSPEQAALGYPVRVRGVITMDAPAHALDEFTQAVVAATLSDANKQEVVEAVSTIAEQAAKKPEERSKGTLKALVAWIPTAISAANNLVTLWDKIGPSIKGHLGI